MGLPDAGALLGARQPHNPGPFVCPGLPLSLSLSVETDVHVFLMLQFKVPWCPATLCSPSQEDCIKTRLVETVEDEGSRCALEDGQLMI